MTKRRTRLVPVVIGIAAVVLIGFVGWRVNLLNVRTAPPFGSVAATFDDPLPYPGFVWTRHGRPVPAEELNTIAGPGHCRWQAATLLHIGWPPGTFAPDASRARQYVRDPKGAIHHEPALRERLGRSVPLPVDARPTGHRLGAIELYVSPSDQDEWIYLVSPADIERWPRSEPMTLCM